MSELKSFQKFLQVCMAEQVCLGHGRRPDSWPKTQAGLRPKFQVLRSKAGHRPGASAWNGANIRAAGLTQSRTFLLNDMNECASSTVMCPGLASLSGGLLSAMPESRPKLVPGGSVGNLEGWGRGSAGGGFRARSQPGHCGTIFLQNSLPQCGPGGKGSSGLLGIHGVPDMVRVMGLHTSQQLVQKVLATLFSYIFY